MKILAIDTATSASSIALGEDDELVAMSVRVDRRGHGGFLVPAIDFAFDSAGWKPQEIDVIAVDIGPGLFTGKTGAFTLYRLDEDGRTEVLE